MGAYFEFHKWILQGWLRTWWTRGCQIGTVGRNLRYIEPLAHKGSSPPLAGDPHKAIDVEDYWVFERPILKAWIVPRPGPQDATWRLVERLSYNK